MIDVLLHLQNHRKAHLGCAVEYLGKYAVRMAATK